MNFIELELGLDQNTLELLTAAFEAAWVELQAFDGHGIADEVAARDALGRRIIAAAIKLGARDAEKLKRMALEGLIG